MNDPASAEQTVEDLRRVGIRVALDDFGTGHSSLGPLARVPFRQAQIDRTFVSSILDDRPSEHIIRAILAMCEGLGMDVVAEGIELEAQAAALSSSVVPAGKAICSAGRSTPTPRLAISVSFSAAARHQVGLTVKPGLIHILRRRGCGSIAADCRFV